MASNRIGRINEAIREALAGLLRTVKDPRVTESMLTITHVDTTSDLRYARVYISALNCQDEKGLMKGLKSASGYLRHELGQKVDLRYTPELQFIMDDSIAHGAHILDLLSHGNEREQTDRAGDGGGPAGHGQCAAPDSRAARRRHHRLRRRAVSGPAGHGKDGVPAV